MNNNINIIHYIDIKYSYIILKLNLLIILKRSGIFKVYEYVLE